MSSPLKSPDVGSSKSTQNLDSSISAAFAPTKLTSRQERRTVTVQQKSPLLIATPPQVTRALAFSHPFLLPLNKLVGLVSWSSGDPWESFLVVTSFWGIVVYGDAAIRWGGPIVAVAILILCLYSRRYSPLSSRATSGAKVKGRDWHNFEGSTRHQKSLDEILDTLSVFTSRCNILLDPLFDLTDFLSTQISATSATTRPALMTLFFRILLFTPAWIALTIPPIQIITSQRVILVTGTLILSWHSRPARVTRQILWRSRAIRYMCSVITGLDLLDTGRQNTTPLPLPLRTKSQHDIASSLAINTKSSRSGVRFTFTIYENQRRWLGLGWTASLFAYERAAWTDEHLNPSQPKDSFELPVVENGAAKWQWVPGSEWRYEGPGKSSLASPGKVTEGWIYYDNKWSDGRQQDGWGRYTRRRKWYRDAELVESIDGLDGTPAELSTGETEVLGKRGGESHESMASSSAASGTIKSDEDAKSSQMKRRRFFGRDSKTSTPSSTYSSKTLHTSDEEQDHLVLPKSADCEGDWDVGDDVKMGLG